MSTVFDPPRRPRRHILTFCMPTPNGRLHLGHVAGPYLRVDVLGRHLRRRGDEPYSISGTDGYESYVLLSAHREGRAPEEVALDYHAGIVRDLAALAIQSHAFISPFAPRWHDHFTAGARAELDHLIATRDTILRTERVPVATSSGRIIAGCWVLGRCPMCKADSGGGFCEGCGYNHRPEELEDAHARLDEGPLEWHELKTRWLRFADPAGFTRSLPTTPHFQKHVAWALERQGGLTRITIPGRWGRVVPGAPGEVPQVLDTYGPVGLNNYFLAIGEAFRELTGAEVNPFTLGADVNTLLAVGFDNIVPAMVGVQGGLVEGGHRPLDQYLFNYFLDLAGAKFSTSRGHAIWASDIVEKTPLTSDQVRMCMARLTLEDAPANLSLEDLVTAANRLAELWPAGLAAAPVAAEAPGTPPSAIVNAVAASLERQDRALDVARLQPSVIVEEIERWLTSPCPAAAGYWWRKGLALIASPVTPGLAGALWSSLGHDGEPRAAEFHERRRPTGAVAAPPLARVSLADLEPCLPPTMRGAA
jgi:methionyl-tRNA synthetase